MLRENVRPWGGTLRAALVAAGIGVFVSSGASAGTVVTTWGFELNAGFTAFTDENPGGTHPVTGSNPNAFLEAGPHAGPVAGCTPGPGCNPNFIPDYASAPSKLSWGVPHADGGNNQSSIEIGLSNGHYDSATDGSGPITTGGPEVATVLATHNNWVVGLNQGELNTATLTDVLTLKPLTPPQAGPPPIPGVEFYAPQLTISINFEETLNSLSGSNCPQGNPGGLCSDVFVFDVEGAGFTVIPDGSDPDSESDIVLDQAFFFDTGDGAEMYNARVRLEGLQQLTEDECQVADMSISGSCFGLVTIENQVNSFQTFLSIQHVPQSVAEPATLAVLGLGLVGLGFARRRRSA